MRILLTRPLHQSARSADRLRNLGHEVLIEPLLQIHQLDTQLPAGRFDGIILTSSNAVPPLDRHWPRSDRDNVPVLATGESTRKTAAAIGFSNTTSVGGSARTIITELPGWLKQQGLTSGPDLLYPGAETLSVDLTTELSRSGVTCCNWPVYRSIPVKQLSPALVQAFQQGKIGLTLLYSARTASAFARLVSHHNISLDTIATAALSEQVKIALPRSMSAGCRVARNPDENSLFDLI